MVKGQAGLPGPVGVDGNPGLPGQKGEKVSTVRARVRTEIDFFFFLQLHKTHVNQRFAFFHLIGPL